MLRTPNMDWEVDWGHAGNTGTQVWARKPKGHIPSSRAWHWVKTGSLRKAGINTPTYRSDSWEVDWSKRNRKLVWARNPLSKMPKSRTWHWVDFHTLEHAGIKWKPKSEYTGRYLANGYVLLTRRAMSEDDVVLAERHGLFRGSRKTFVREHQLAAVKKFGAIPKGHVVRHRNGIKSDNTEDNILLGTSYENTMDHNSARITAMYWHNQYDLLLRRCSSALGRAGRSSADARPTGKVPCGPS